MSTNDDDITSGEDKTGFGDTPVITINEFVTLVIQNVVDFQIGWNEAKTEFPNGLDDKMPVSIWLEQFGNLFNPQTEV